MDPQAKAIWLEALRSGRYRQGNGYLMLGFHTHTEHCCMGVLGKVLSVLDDDLRDQELLDDDVLDQAGLTPDDQDMLSNMNDRGTTFAEIADYIEENL